MIEEVVFKLPRDGTTFGLALASFTVSQGDLVLEGEGIKILPVYAVLSAWQSE